MRWHKDGRQDDDNTLRHSADAIVRKEFDKAHNWFAHDSSNVRLGLTSDGFNPFGPGAPRNDINVYLQPLIDDLHKLWNEGVSTYDALTKETFQMRATLLWTINDFPG
ncbi:hypothetical protein SLA2020_279040 [Shorea laevis]